MNEALKLSESETNDDLDFVVTETVEQDPEFVGGTAKFPAAKDDLDLQTTSDLVQDEGRMHSEEGLPGEISNLQRDDFHPIGETDSPLPPTIDDTPAPASPPVNLVATPEPKAAPPAEPKSDPHPTTSAAPPPDGLFLSDREKEEIIRKIGNSESMSQPVKESPSPSHSQIKSTNPTMSPSDLPTPEIAKRGCGIAYFYRNYIQITGSQQLHPNDEILVGNRAYKLKSKQIRPGFLVSVSASLFAAALILVGSFMLSTGDTDDGEVIGIVLDRSGEPFVDGAIIRFPELGHAVESNPEGFFRSGDIPSGSHKMVYKIDGRIVAEEYITVASGKVSTISLAPGSEISNSSASSPPKPAQRSTVAQTGATAKSTASKAAPPSKKSTSKSTKSTSSYAKITLASNIDGARLSLDGSVVGAGNMTYSRIKAGKHSYVVEADGYAPASGEINLKAGQTQKLEAILTPMETAKKEEVYSAEDFYYSGVSLVKEGENQTAIDDFTKAIELEPAYGDAYLARADVHAKIKKTEPAHDDYIRAAEIFRFQKNFNRAISAYNSAVEMDKKSITAYLGRGDLYLAKGQEIAAIADYDAAKKVNKKNPAAHIGLGKARFQLDNHKRAIKHFKEARKLDANNPIVYQYLMLSYLAVDNLKEVKKNFEKFAKVANNAEMERMVNDQKYSAVLHIVDEDR